MLMQSVQTLKSRPLRSFARMPREARENSPERTKENVVIENPESRKRKRRKINQLLRKLPSKKLPKPMPLSVKEEEEDARDNSDVILNLSRGTVKPKLLLSLI